MFWAAPPVRLGDGQSALLLKLQSSVMYDIPNLGLGSSQLLPHTAAVLTW